MFSCRYLFGSDVVAQFNQANDIEMICRAHQLVMEVSFYIEKVPVNFVCLILSKQARAYKIEIISRIVGLQVAFQRNSFNGLECAKLLLSMWKRSCHSRVR